MVLKADQQRVKDLLKDTITLLCRNGLEYNAEFCIEALIGITLDKSNVVLVSINETVKSGTTAADSTGPEADPRGESTFRGSQAQSSKVKQERKRPRSCGAPVSASGLQQQHEQERWDIGQDDMYSSEESNDGGVHDESSNLSEVSHGMRLPKVPKVEVEGSGDMDTPIIIKEELDIDSFDNSCAMSSQGSSFQGNLSFSTPGSVKPLHVRATNNKPGHDPDLSQVLHTTLGPGGMQPGSQMWMDSGSTGLSQLAPGDDDGGASQMGGTGQQEHLSNPHGNTVSSGDWIPTSYGMFKCNICSKEFNSESGYMDHRRRHAGQFRYFCHICNKGDMSFNHLEGHMNKHQGVKPFPCPICGMAFPHRSSTKRHMRLKHNTN